MKQPFEFKSQAVALVAGMTLEEKASLMSGSSFWHLQALAAYDLPPIMVADGPHGLRKQSHQADHMGLSASVRATCFPTAVTLASSWDRALISEVGAAIGRECQAEGVSVLLAPGVNIKRSPLCGRNFEYYAEDPYLAGEMATAFVQGVQSTGVGTSIKHFAVNNQEAQRMVVDTLVDRRSLFEIYLPAFEVTVVRAQPWTVMCAYNRVNGTYCSEHQDLLSTILRDRWGFQGLVVSDWGAVNDRPNGVAAGLDLEMPSSGGINDRQVAAHVRNADLEEAYLDQAAVRVTQLILAAKNNCAPQQVDFDAHHKLAQKAASDGAVLLKNEKLLPLSRGQSIALIGAFAEAPRFQGAGSSQVNAWRLDKPIDAFIERFGSNNITYVEGFDAEMAAVDAGAINDAVIAAQGAEIAVIMAGLPALFEAEGYDRNHLRLPEQIESLIAAVAAANKNCVVVLSNGAPIEMPWLDQVSAVLELYLAGQAGAHALVDLLVGDINPSGKLAETFPRNLADCPAQDNFANHERQIIYREGLNIGYRYFTTHDVRPLFPFGHGLSYTSFAYSDATLCSDWTHVSETVDVAVTITNTGDRAGAEVVQLYVRDRESTAYRPDRELKAFQKVMLQPGEAKQLRFTLDKRAFAYFDVVQDDWDIEPGIFDILFGASCTDIRASVAVTLPAGSGRNSTPVSEASYVTMADAQLAALGLTLTPAEAIKPYHANSTLADIRHHWIGKRVAQAALEMAAKTMGKRQESAVAIKMREEMIMSLRLKTVQIMSGGSLTNKRFELLLYALNNRWLHFLIRMLRP